MSRKPIYGLLAEFKEPEKLVEIATQAREAGYRRIDGFSPYPVEGLAEALGSHHTKIPVIALVGGLIGCFGGYFMLYSSAVAFYPINVAGRPFHSWPMFIPITFELTILFSGLFTVVGLLASNGLPKPHHPVFAVPQFSLATDDRFFFCIEAADPSFDPEKSRDFLNRFDPIGVYVVDET
ncbi:MAG TPA: DUF3341 domain-containing protein [Terriglobia bacterium]|nr:DUF3341 domain-containing protein [Terriglobia bacterium]